MLANKIIDSKMERDRQLVRFKALPVGKTLALNSLQFLSHRQGARSMWLVVRLSTSGEPATRLTFRSQRHMRHDAYLGNVGPIGHQHRKMWTGGVTLSAAGSTAHTLR
jgi:hypothetical protein